MINKNIKRLMGVKPSASVTIFNQANRMKSSGIDVANLSAGEPDFDTPMHIKKAAQDALLQGKTKYPPPAGVLELRELIANKLRKENKLNYQAENIIVSNGGKQGLFNLVFSLIESGDEVIIPAPYWVSYPDIVRLADGIPVVVETKEKNAFKLTAELLEENINSKTKLLIFNSPSNPTGSVYRLEELEEIAEVVIKNDLFVLSDEIYEKILYDGIQHHSIAGINQEMLSRTAVSNGFSKSYAMTGWRLGYVAAPVSIVRKMTTIQGHITSGVCTFAQYGGIAALRDSDEYLHSMMKSFMERRQYVLEYVSQILKLNYIQPDGAFYIFVNISPFGLGSLEFCERLLTEYKVAVIPGVAFGIDSYIRISYATDLESVKDGLDKLGKYLSELSKSKLNVN
jgi:aspartate aminotransferase